MTNEELKTLYYSHYVTKDGLGLIGKDHAQNSNGILFLGYQLAKFVKAKLFNQDDINRAFHACEATKVIINGVEVDGVYKRGVGNDELDAHDNLVGRAGVSVFCEFDYARKMADHGNKSGWSFHSVDPSKQELRTTVQGGTICFIKMCAGYIPYPTEYVWMLGGILVAGFFGTPSTVNINNFAIEVLDMVFEKKFSKTHWTYLAYPLVRFLFKIGVKRKYSSVTESYKKYFEAGHPLILMSENLNEKHSI